MNWNQEVIKKVEEANNLLGQAWLLLYGNRVQSLEPWEESLTKNYEIRMVINNLQVRCYDAIEALEDLQKEEAKNGL